MTLETSTTRSDIKFLVGFAAGLAAALMPRLSTSVISGDMENMAAISGHYLLVAAIFGCVVGLVVMIFEWHVAKEPKATFIMALGVPALFTGAANSLDSTNHLHSQLQETKELSQQLENYFNVPVSQGVLETLEPLEPLETGFLDFSFITDAHAAEPTLLSENGFNPSIRQQTAHAVLLERFDDKQQALARAADLNQIVGEVVVMRSGGKYVLVLADTRMSRSQALLKVLQLRRDFQINAEVMALQ